MYRVLHVFLFIQRPEQRAHVYHAPEVRSIMIVLEIDDDICDDVYQNTVIDYSLGVAHDLCLHAAVFVHLTAVLLLDVEAHRAQHHAILVVFQQGPWQET